MKYRINPGSTPPDSGREQYDHAGLKVAVLCAKPGAEISGGAERLYDGLLDGLLEIGCDAKQVTFDTEESSFSRIEKNYQNCANYDLSDFDVVISTKAPTFAASHARHVMYLMHTVRVYDDMFQETFHGVGIQHYLERAKLHEMDFKAMSKIKARFAIGHEVANRLYRWRGLSAEVIHPPLAMRRFGPGPTGDYFFIAGRLHPWKRIDLLIEAIKASAMPLRLVIAGTGEAEADLKRLSGADPRIRFVGRVDDETLIDLYANALAVPFVPIREDFGYVTLEAFASGKAVVTCLDSGEPTHFVRNNETGLICSPDAPSIRKTLEWLFTHPEDARRMGQNAAASVNGPDWPAVAKRLVDAALHPEMKSEPLSRKVTVVDMQPIDPPVGGGRLRLLGLYHNLGPGIRCKYVGTYDWPGEKYRRHRLSESLEEIDIPLSDRHHTAALALSARAGGKTVIDISFGRLGSLSQNYVKEVKRLVRQAETVVFSHPWVFPLVEGALQPNQVIVYDAQNVEGYLRARLLDEANPVEADLLRRLVEDEYRLGCRADLIFACSREDLNRFHRIYEFGLEKIRVVPNGVMAFSDPPPETGEKRRAKAKLGMDEKAFVAFFIGSPYGPNRDAAQFICETLAGRMPDVVFAIAGGVGSSIEAKPSNVVICGNIDEDTKRRWLEAADVAINPMFSGSGTNIKMFEFMASGLPTVTTAIGARGIDAGELKPFMVVAPGADAFVEAIKTLRNAPALRAKFSIDARKCIEEGYSWERISHLVGTLLTARQQLAGQGRPFFSVVIPSYQRHGKLSQLLRCLQGQIERDFEVIIVDQSKRRWDGADHPYPFPLVYYRSPVRGAVRARNTGAMLSQGRVIAFTDDDCLPDRYWLLNARKYFNRPEIVGVEGKITSDHLDDPEWRTVMNIGVEGLAFMTANLMVKSSVFQKLGGFDLKFDLPHFREDTDFGWRMQEVGSVPYAKDVKVFHPAQRRNQFRESAEERTMFFVKDALLYQKHPQRYKELFFKERHFELTPGFKENLLAGFHERKIAVPDWLEKNLKKGRRFR